MIALRTLGRMVEIKPKSRMPFRIFAGGDGVDPVARRVPTTDRGWVRGRGTGFGERVRAISGCRSGRGGDGRGGGGDGCG